MLFVHHTQKTRGREIIVTAGLKTEVQLNGEGDSANPRGASWDTPCISEGNREVGYEMRAGLPDTNNVVISTDSTGTAAQTEVRDNVIAH